MPTPWMRASPPVSRHLSKRNVAGCTSAEGASKPPVQVIPQDVPAVRAKPSVSPKERIAQELRKIILDLSGMAVEDDHVSFMDLGFDSLFLSQASQAIDNRFGIKITFRQLLADLSTVASITSFLETQIPSEMFAEVEPPPMATVPLPSSSVTSATLPAISNGAMHSTSDIQQMLDTMCRVCNTCWHRADRQS